MVSSRGLAVGDWLKLEPPEPAQLIYMDPPYMSQRDYKDFDDRWDSREDYLDWIKPRLERCREHLRDDGSFMLHCDPTASHYLKLMLDTIFGADNFANEIIWAYRGTGAKKKFGSKHDTLLFYRKSQDFIFNPQYTPMLEATKKLYRHDDNDGKGIYLLVKNKKTGKQYKSYLNKNRGRPVLDWWEDIQSFNTAYSSKERTGYPTQKPLKLLRRIINATTNPGDLVIDPMCGSGTTLVAAKQANRLYWGCDINPRAIQISERRLMDVMASSEIFSPAEETDK